MSQGEVLSVSVIKWSVSWRSSESIFALFFGLEFSLWISSFCTLFFLLLAMHWNLDGYVRILTSLYHVFHETQMAMAMAVVITKVATRAGAVVYAVKVRIIAFLDIFYHFYFIIFIFVFVFLSLSFSFILSYI